LSGLSVALSCLKMASTIHNSGLQLRLSTTVFNYGFQQRCLYLLNNQNHQTINPISTKPAALTIISFTLQSPF
jgi:hypothetical protein